MKQLPYLSAFFLTACVTINIYFPAAAAEKVADEIIQEIQKDQVQEQPLNQESGAGLSGLQVSVYRMLDQAIDLLITPAHAGANLSVDSAEIRKIRAGMRARFKSLRGFYSKGNIGIKSDGMLTARGNVPLKDRNKVNKLVAAENADRNRLYQAIANANGHPEWFAQIKSTFAKRWIGNAQPGWSYQLSNGSWKQK